MEIMLPALGVNFYQNFHLTNTLVYHLAFLMKNIHSGTRVTVVIIKVSYFMLIKPLPK